MNFRVGACALLVCLAGCSAEAPDARMGAQTGKAATQLTGQKLRTIQMDRRAAQSIANAPDRGTLIEYKNKGAALKQEGAYTWYPIAISEAHALKAVVTGEMTIPSPDGTQVKLKYERHEEQADGNWTWIGQVVGGDQRREAILTFGEKAVFGTIPQLSGSPLSVQTRGGALFVVKTDPSKVKNPNVAATDMMVPPALALRSRLLASAPTVKAAELSGTKAASAATTVDVAIGYTQGFASVPGGQSAAVTRLVNLVAIGNAAFNNSLITGALRLVNAVQVSYPDNTSNQTALEELTGIRNQQPITVPASLAPLRTAREQYGADLAILVRKFQAPENQGCGIAWLNGAGQMPINPSVDDDYAFAVVSDGGDSDGNNNYFCAEESLIHEVGHLMGSAHDRDNSKIEPNNPPGGANLLYGAYPYSFGMKTTAANGNFYTIMSYGADNQNANPVFSNPLVMKCGPDGATLPCGVANQTDNARSLNQTIPVVATFRASVVPLASKAVSDINGDGRSDLFWHSIAAQSTQAWLMNGTSYSYNPVNKVGSAYRTGGMGDVNGDGRADIIWYDQSKAGSTNVYVWLSSASGAYTIASLRGYPVGWNIVGVADANGDGRADIFWHNPTSGALEYWLMNGTAITYGGARSVSNIYRVAAIGDLTGDGRADIVWMNTAKTELWLWTGSASGTYAVARMKYAGYPTGWDLVGTGDVNADGRADLFWHNPTTGALEYWLMNGVTPTYGGARAVATQYRVAAIGDYNGDGRADLVWTNTAKTELWMWAGSATGAFAITRISFPGGYPAGWNIFAASRPPA